MPSYQNLDNVLRPSVGQKLTAAWCDAVNDNFNYLNARPQFQVHLSTVQSIANGTLTKVAYDVVDQDSRGGWSTANRYYVIPAGEGGFWQFWCSIQFASNATGSRFIAINGQVLQWVSAGVDGLGRCSGSLLVYYGAGSTVEVDIYQTSGAALNTATGSLAVQFSGIRVG